jgi:hypothetical protein
MTIAQMVSQVTAAPKATLKAVKAPKTHAELMEAVQVVTGAPASPNCTVDQLKSILAGINKAPKAKSVKAPKAPKAAKTPKAPKAKKVTKYDLLRMALKEGNKTLEALINASGFDAKNVRVSISILRGRFGMEIAYDKEAKTYTASEVGAPVAAVDAQA